MKEAGVARMVPRSEDPPLPAEPYRDGPAHVAVDWTRIGVVYGDHRIYR
jgi:hypothetical protein